MVSIDLTAVFGESEVKVLRAGLKELTRCSRELRREVPDFNHVSEVDLLNLINTDRPELRKRLQVLLNTMNEIRLEVERAVERASIRLQEQLCAAMEPGSEVFITRSVPEELLAEVLSQ